MNSHKHTEYHDYRPDSGFVLVSALWLMALIGLMVAAASTNFAYSSKLSQSRMAHSKNQSASTGVVSLIAMQLQQTANDGTLASNIDLSGQFNCSYREIVDVQFSIHDHDGLIDLNAGSAELIQLGFLALGFPTSQAEFLSERVLDYRDRDKVTGKGQLESIFYTNAESIYLPKNSRIFSIFELDQLPIEQKFNFMSLSRVFTVKSGLDGIDSSKATSALQASLSQTNLTQIANRKSREHFYSIDVLIDRSHPKNNSGHGSRTINFVEFSSRYATNIKLSPPWRVPLNEVLDDTSANASTSVPCSKVLAG